MRPRPWTAGSPRAGSFYGEAKKEKLPSVRELAVLPVQRVMRYVLQYRGTFWLFCLVDTRWLMVGRVDLLQSTPVDSPSRGLVERALESAMRE